MNDQKSVFGIFVGLIALFAFWLWATGRYAQLATALGAAPAAVAGAAASSVTGSAGAPAAAASSSAVTIPNYANTSQAVQSLQLSTPYGLNLGGANMLGGFTVAGATSGGVSVTPTVFANSQSVPPVTSQAGGDWLSGLFADLTGTTTLTAGAASGGNDAANVAGGNSAPLG